MKTHHTLTSELILEAKRSKVKVTRPMNAVQTMQHPHVHENSRDAKVEVKAYSIK